MKQPAIHRAKWLALASFGCGDPNRSITPPWDDADTVVLGQISLNTPDLLDDTDLRWFNPGETVRMELDSDQTGRIVARGFAGPTAEGIKKCGVTLGGKQPVLPKVRGWTLGFQDGLVASEFEEEEPVIDLDLRFANCAPVLSACDAIRFELISLEAPLNVNLRLLEVSPMGLVVSGEIQDSHPEVFFLGLLSEGGEVLSSTTSRDRITSIAHDGRRIITGTSSGHVNAYEPMGEDFGYVGSVDLFVGGSRVRTTETGVLGYGILEPIARFLGGPDLELPFLPDQVVEDGQRRLIAVSRSEGSIRDASGAWTPFPLPDRFVAGVTAWPTPDGLAIISGDGSYLQTQQGWVPIVPGPDPEAASERTLRTAAGVRDYTVFGGENQTIVARTAEGGLCDLQSPYPGAHTNAIAAIDANRSVAVTNSVHVSLFGDALPRLMLLTAQ